MNITANNESNSGNNEGHNGENPQGSMSPDILQMIGHTQQQSQHASQISEQNHQMLSKLKEVFSPQEKKADSWYDNVLRAAIEAEKNGNPIPLTVDISSQLKLTQEQNRILQEKLSKLEQRENWRSNPETSIDQAAYNHVDMFMSQELSSAFDGNIPQPLAQAVTADLVQRIQHEQVNNPERWRQIRSNPDLMRTIVKNAVAQFVPPRARTIINQDNMMNSDYSDQDALDAIREARELMSREEIQNNPLMMKKLQHAEKRGREMFWEAKMLGQKGKSRI